MRRQACPCRWRRPTLRAHYSSIAQREEKVLSLTTNSVASEYRSTSSSEAEIHDLLQELLERGLIRQASDGAWLRVAHNEQDVQMVRHMPQVASADRPTIAIITAQYAEKLAVSHWSAQT